MRLSQLRGGRQEDDEDDPPGDAAAAAVRMSSGEALQDLIVSKTGLNRALNQGQLLHCQLEPRLRCYW